jgi:hypothetical protein
MLLTPGTCSSGDCTPAREYTLRYRGRHRHPDANVFRLRETGSVPTAAHLNPGRPRTVRTPANENATITAVRRQRQVFERIYDYQLHTYHYSRSAYPFPNDRPLRKQFCEWLHKHTKDELFSWSVLWTDEAFFIHVMMCSTATTIISGHRIIPMLYANVGIM